MKLESKTYQFPEAHASVIFTNEMCPLTHVKRPLLQIQCIDQYRYQREWSIGLKRTSGTHENSWVSSIYQHPGRRYEVTIGSARAKSVIERFLYLCENYPQLLFNKTGEHISDVARPRSEGFVHFAEQLHRGALPSKKML